MKIVLCFMLCLTPFVSVEARQPCNKNNCNLALFPRIGSEGTDDLRFERAIDAARGQLHKTLYIPNGIYTFHKGIVLKEKVEILKILGESTEKTILYLPQGGTGINILHPGGHDEVHVSILRLSIKHNEKHDASHDGHGIRVGNGWKKGSLLIERVSIFDSPYYGIGIQNSGANALPANDITIRNVKIVGTGSDGIDTKRPLRAEMPNQRLVIENVAVKDFGWNDALSSAAIDVGHEDFTLRRILISSKACLQTKAAKARVDKECDEATKANASDKNKICSQKPEACVVGVRINSRDGGASKNGQIDGIGIRGTKIGIFFNAKDEKDLNENVSIQNFLIEGHQSVAVYMRGKNHSLLNGCIGFGEIGSRDIVYSKPIEPLTIREGNVMKKQSKCNLVIHKP